MSKSMAVIIKGKSESGKTTKIKLIAEKLINKGAKVIYQEELRYPNGTDFWYILEYKQNLFAITTQGDSKADLEKWYNHMQKNLENYTDKSDFDYYICACRTWGETAEFVNQIFKDCKLIYHASWRIKVNDFDVDDKVYNIANVAQADGIIKIIENSF